MEGIKFMKYYKAKSSDIVGEVNFGNNCSVFYNAVIRADHHPIIIGENTNIQDCCVIHTGTKYPVNVGNNVTIGHGAIVHGCEIGDNVIVGMGAIIMNGAKIGAYSIVGAGAVVTEHTEIKEGTVVVGTPAKPIRNVTDKEREYSLNHALSYAELAMESLDEVSL